jgi:hypothetical protein
MVIIDRCLSNLSNNKLNEVINASKNKAGLMSDKVTYINKKLLPAYMPIEAKTKVSKN